MADEPAIPAARPRLVPYLVVVAIVWCVSVATFWSFTLFYPHQLSYVEGYLLEQGVRISEGGALYRPLGDPAWIVDNFPPLYLGIIALGVETFGIGFAYGRALSLLGVVGLATMAYHWHKRMGHAAWLALGLVALWLVSPHLILRASLMRMDLPGILLSGGALLGYLALRERWPTGAVVVAALLSAAALGMRQTLLAAPLALVVTMLATGRRLDALRYLGILVGIGILAVFVLQGLTEGRFLRHVVTYNTGRYVVPHYLFRAATVTGLQLSLLLLGVLGAVAAWRSGPPDVRPLALWLLIAAVFTLTAGKPGSSYNHFLEVLFVAGLLSGHGLRWLAARWPEQTKTDPMQRIAVLLIGILLVQGTVTAITIPASTTYGTLSDREDDAAIVALLATAPAPVLSENAGAVVQAGHDLLLEPRTLLEMHLVGRWDDTPLVASLQNQTYTVIILETFPPTHHCTLGCRFSDASWRALTEHYEHTGTHGRWQEWRPVQADP